MRGINLLENFMDENEWFRFTMAIGTFALIFILQYGAKKLIRRRLRRYSSSWALNFINDANWPVNGLFVVIAAGVAFQLVPDFVRDHPLVTVAVKIGLVVFGVWTLDRIFSVLLNSPRSLLDLNVNTRVFLMMFVRVGMFSIMLLIVLDMLGISITPLLASLGVGSVAVALALQDTLSNFFSGIYLLIDKPFRVGDYVKVDPGAEGTVRSVGWRTTQIDLPTLNTVFIPNSKLSSAILTNFDLPAKQSSVNVVGTVAYGADLDKVEKLATETARSCMQNVPGGVEDWQPLVRFNSLDANSIGFIVVIRAKSYADLGLLRHEFIKSLHRRFLQEGIAFNSPATFLASPKDATR